MTLRLTARPALPLLLAVAGIAVPMQAQQLIGYVNTRDADITGATDVLDGQAVLMGAVSVTAKDHTAPITLGRGGTVRVCQTSVLHVTESRAVAAAAPLLFSLDRGAIEIQTNGTPTDAIMTPDMRFTIRNAGPLDLRLRVARNGDTCVENRGPVAPTLAVSDPFGESMYEVGPGQHILFEHGSLREVVDHETSPCGCPEYKGVSVADALLASGGPKPAAPSAATPPVAVQPAPAPPPVIVQTPPQPAVAQTPPPAIVQAPPQPAAVQTPPPAIVQAPKPAIVQAPKPAIVQTPPPAAVQTPPPAVVQPRPAAVPAPAPAPVQPPPIRTAPAQAPVQPNDLATLQATEQAAEQTAAQSAIRAAERSATQTAAQAADRHPFPAAISEGLAPPAEAPPVPPGQQRAQITDALSYNAPSAAPAATPAPAAASRAKKAPAPKPAAAPPVAAPPAKAAAPTHPPPHDLVSFFGSFFRKLFGRS